MSILKLLEISINNLINVKEDFVEEAQVSTDQGVEHRHKMPLLPNPPLYPPHEHHTHTLFQHQELKFLVKIDLQVLLKNYY